MARAIGLSCFGLGKGVSGNERDCARLRCYAYERKAKAKVRASTKPQN